MQSISAGGSYYRLSKRTGVLPQQYFRETDRAMVRKMS